MVTVGTRIAPFPRLRALAVFGRRQPQPADGPVLPAPKNLHMNGHSSGLSPQRKLSIRKQCREQSRALHRLEHGQESKGPHLHSIPKIADTIATAASKPCAQHRQSKQAITASNPWQSAVIQWRVGQPEGRIMRTSVVAVALALVIHASAHGEDYPSRQVALVVPFASGGASDVLGKTVAKAMGSLLGQPVKVENAEGAGGIIGTNRVVKAAPDGYTLLFAQSGITASTTSNRRQIDVISNSLKPIGLIAHEPFLIIGRKSLPAQSLRELVLWLRAHPYGVSSSAAIGSHSHLANILFQEATGAKLKLALDRSERQSIDDLAAGKIDVLLSSPLMSTPALRSGSIKAFAIAAKERTSLAPDIPSVDEAGLTGFYFSRWYALWAPRRTPDNIVAKLNDAMVRTLNDPEVARTFAGAGLLRFPRDQMAPDVLDTYQKTEFERWLPVQRQLSARLRRA